MPHTISKGKNVYSVDLMFAYINIFTPKTTKITKIKLDQINYIIWTLRVEVKAKYQLMMY